MKACAKKLIKLLTLTLTSDRQTFSQLDKITYNGYGLCLQEYCSNNKEISKIHIIAFCIYFLYVVSTCIRNTC